LRDAFAGTTTSLRAKFVPDEIPVLVRNGLLQVALDGFDEFVDPSGYRDAWGALKDFIRECGSSGPLILAGRDTFFDQQNFKDQLSTAGGGVQIVLVRLSEVTPSTAKDWLEKGGWPKSEIESNETLRYLRDGSYILRPFFLSRIRPLKGWASLRDSRTSPQTFVIDDMIWREANLLSVPLALPIETISNALERLFENVAEDMAEREVDSIPLHYLNFLGEYAFEDVIPKEHISRLQHSLGTIVFIEKGESTESVRFPHSEVQNRFLARVLIRRLAEKTSIPFLARAILGMDRMEAFAERVLECELDEVKAAVRRLRYLLEEESQTVRMTLNVTALLLSSLCRPDAFESALVLDTIGANDVRAIQTMGAASITNSSIARLDARNADLSDIMFDTTTISTLVVDRSSRLGATVPSIDLIQISEPSGTTQLRDRTKIDAWLRDHSALGDRDSENDWQLPLVKHFDRICRRFIAQIYIRDNPKDPGSFLLTGEYWNEIRRILTDHHRLEAETRATSGQKNLFYSIVYPERLLNPSIDDTSSLRIREEIVARARELR
jgi:hypothetical protein